ncbi:hypothetical protein BaRGS_00011675 [Batillaria attramentaria]|uniref:Sulfite oxidase n=1 Tax=Batillaria attramentaria TaxID=370345 RepID=A0ABD0LCN5_9CAEN
MFSSAAPKFIRSCGVQAWKHHHRCFPNVSVLASPKCSVHHESSGRESCNNSQARKAVHVAAAVGTACLLGASLYWKAQYDRHEAAEFSQEGGKFRTGLPTYTLAEVAQHKTKETRIWVTYKNGVYDITDYVTSHPGGTKILLAAGGPMEPYWNLYGVHKHPGIIKIAEKYRIGNITERPPAESVSVNDPYGSEPARNPVLIPSSKKPFNAEPPALLLVDSFLTPNELFYVRNHLPVPQVNLKTYTLDVEGPKKVLKFTYDDLIKLPKKSVAAVVQCAGNRRSDMVDIKPVKGLNWGAAAIGNAEWSGVRLSDLLKQCGVNLDTTTKKHLVFEGMDKGPEGSVYGASIPIELAKSLKDEIILAYEMNGKQIPRDHGYPVRVIIPGVVGARQVKWLNKIYLSDEESECHWQRRDYKGFNSSIDWHNVDFDSSVAIMQLPVVSAICDPPAGTELEEGSEDVTVRGYAWSGGGRGIIRVDVSADGGKTWHTAELQPNGQTPYRAWAWTLWEATVPLPEGHVGPVELVCKAVDVSYNVQPDGVEGVWNLRGVLNNAWHRVTVTVPPPS